MTLLAETALKKRAKQLLVAMTERERYVYALPRLTNEKNSALVIAAVMDERAIPRAADDADGKVVRYASDASAQFIVFDHAELDVVFIEASGGGGVVPTMQQILEHTGFVAQSKLLGVALDVGRADAPRALQVLAHMVVAWDDDWTDLFLLHLASPDPLVRRSALDALTIAAMVAQETQAARELLAEAARREKMPKLAAAIADAERVLGALAGDAIDISQLS
jgi:hypothetical protein